MKVKDVLKELGVRPSKALGQNFLIDASVVSTIVDFGRPSAADTIVEIGPGLGALTRELNAVRQPLLIEIEAEFCERLAREFPGVRIISEDVRGVDFGSLGGDLLVFGNLPYSFSSDIIFHLISQAKCIRRAVLLLQKEFVERLGAEPGGRDYGVLSIMCQLWADVHFGPVISGRAFHPVAQVDSQLVELSFLGSARFPVSDLFWFRRFVTACFTKRRKKLSNSLKASRMATGDQIEGAFRKTGLDPNRRPETLSIQEFVELAEAFRPAE